MSIKEIKRIEVLEKLEGKQMSQAAAALQLGLSARQIRRMQKGYRQEGAKSLVSRRRGKPGNNRLAEEVKTQVIQLISAHYADFGPTLAHEKLIECHKLSLSRESVRQLMVQAGYWKGRMRPTAAIHPRRLRRAQVGELVQLDGSPHDWFEGRAERCCLLVWIDDATSRLLHLHFEAVESTQGYFRGMKAYLKKHGIPLSLYTDRHSIFRQNQGSDLKEQEETQFARAVKSLGIELIYAHSPQAKGRVERANGILQDRLVKELRLRGIHDIRTANVFLPEFIEDYNRRFGVMPTATTDSHRRFVLSDEMMDLTFSTHHYRKLSKNLELSFGNKIYQVRTATTGYRLRQTNILVSENTDGKITLWHEGKVLAYTVMPQQERKTVVARPVFPSGKPKVRTHKPAPNHPWRRYTPASAKEVTPLSPHAP